MTERDSMDAVAADRRSPGSEPTDEQLLERCARGERGGIEELTRRYQSALYGFLYRLTGSREDAEEATLEVFIRAWRNAGRFQYRARVGTWLYRIAVNIARDLHSRRKARPQVPWPDDVETLGSGSVGSAEQDAIEALEAQERSSMLRKAIDRLSLGDRQLIVLYYLEDQDYTEMQAVTGLSYTVLKTRLARARRRLRAFLEKPQRDGSL